MRLLYHHRTAAEDGQAVHIRALIEAFDAGAELAAEAGNNDVARFFDHMAEVVARRPVAA